MDRCLITNATIITLGQPNQVIENGTIYIENGRIVEVGPTQAQNYPCPITLDAKGKVVLPGFICAHHHLYSSMARGFAPPGEPAFTFGQILERLWWKLDRALEPEDVRLSADIALCECIRNGTTTIVDHHASPSCRDGSLDILAEAVVDAGLRAVLCYEVSDRNVPGGGVEETARFLARACRTKSDQLAGMVGLHAAFTVGDATLARCREIAEEHHVGYHIHVAEGMEDVEVAQRDHYLRTVERLVDRGICGEKSLFVHCIHINEHELALIRETGTMVVHNPESNMNNAVGVAPILRMLRQGILVGLGTDGMSSDMLSQMRAAYLLHRLHNRDPRVGFMEAPTMLLKNNATILSRLLPVPLGKLEPGAAGDLAVLDYHPPTPLTADNFLGHLIFGMVDATVDSTIVNGRVLMRDKQLVALNEERIARTARKRAPAMWARIQ